MCVALALGIVAVVFSPPADAVAQAARTARGTVTAAAADSVTVKVADHDMTFSVDGKTTVEAVGGGTKARAAEKAGKPGPKLTEVIKVGQPVEVTYHDMSGTMHASRIRAVSTAGAAAAGGAAAKSSNGTVQSVSPTSMTISGSSGAGAKFTQTFTIDADTKVIGKGAGTAAAAKGGKIAATDVVTNGDHVSVSFHPVGEKLHASEIRVMSKAGASK
jgi:hypothetical protein